LLWRVLACGVRHVLHRLVVHHFSPLITAIRHEEYPLPTPLSTGKEKMRERLQSKLDHQRCM
jgi:hypothetical protein